MNTHHARTAAVILIVGAFTWLGTGCSAQKAPTPQDTASTSPHAADPAKLDPATFSTTIDNKFWPMVPGTRWTYRRVDGDGTESRITVTVTSDTKLLANGITARVIRDTVWSGDQVTEDTLDWYAQDADGTIWYLGEKTAEFANGVITSTGGSFEAGVDGALPGIALPADPRPGMAYRQEYYRGEAEDNGQVLSLDEMADAPFGHVTGLLLTKDTTALEPDALEYKLYAPGVGPVLALEVSGGTGGREELVSVEQVPDGAGTGPLGQPD